MGAVPVPGVDGRPGFGRALRTWAIALLLGLTPAVASAEGPTAVRVVTFNLLHGGPSSGLWWGDDHRLDARLALVLRELRTLDPDILGLQESSISGRRNVAERLAAELGLHWAHASATRRISRIGWLDGLLVWAMNFEEGPAILSRWPIVETEIVDLPRCVKFYDPRVVLRAVVETPRGRLQVFSTHTSHDACQVKRLGEIMRAHAGPLPALLMGDFNAAESTDWMQALVRDAELVDAFRAANPSAAGPTVWQRPDAPDSTVTRRVDFIFVGRGREVSARVRASRVVLSTPGGLADGTTLWPSDHYGVLAELSLDARQAGR
jgi:endonuclease/exonuclease/phosphatase family metal-dependent hydrolase